ncbi:MAG: PAS domain S-box protein [Desulfobacterales bacterium]|nr:PAS domain S-box protein [Desulfobacterales bacterium]
MTKAGRKRIVEHKNLLVVNADGTRTVRGIARDVTDVLETEQALVKARSVPDHPGFHRRRLFRGEPGRQLHLLQRCGAHSYRVFVEELLGLNYRQYMDEANSRRVFETFHKVYTTGTPTRSFDWELVKKDGTRIYVEASVSLQRNRNGEPIGFCGIIRDISERKRSEQELAYLAYHDALTGLHNRKAFLEKLDEVIKEARRHENERSILSYRPRPFQEGQRCLRA